MSVTPSSVAEKAIASTKWLVLTETLTKAAAPVTAVILARLLSPTVYGLVAIGVMSNSFAQMFWDAGLSRVLIQTKEAGEEMINATFWLNTMSAVVFYGIVLGGAGWIAAFLNTPEATTVVRFMGLGIIMAALGSVHSTLLTRELNFRRLFWLRASGSLVPVFVTIPLAAVGYGVWALVGGTLAGQALNLGLLWKYSNWRPRLGLDWQMASSMVRRGYWYLGEALLGWFWAQGDSFIVATFLNVHDLGLYRVGRNLVEMVFNTSLSPILQIAYPFFSRLQDARASFNSAFFKANRMIIAVSCLLGVGALLLGPTLVNALYGSKWEGLGPVVGLLGLWMAFSWFVGLNGEVYRAMGRPDITTKLNLTQVAYCIPAFILAAKHGVTMLAAARLGNILLILPVHIYLAHRMMEIPLNHLWSQSKSPLLAAVGMAIVLILISWGWKSAFTALPAWSVILIKGPAALVTFGAVLLFLDRPFVLDAMRLIRRALGFTTA